MFEYINDYEAFVLANTYNLSPPRRVNPGRLRLTDPGKREADAKVGEDSRCMLLAHWFDKTNVLVLYNPNELEGP